MKSTTLYAREAIAALSLLAILSAPARGQERDWNAPPPLTPGASASVVAPNGRFLSGGLGITRRLREHDPLLSAQRNWSFSLWFKTDEASPTMLLAGVGSAGEAFPRYLALRAGHAAFWAGGKGQGHWLEGSAVMAAGAWHSVAIAVDDAGNARLYADGVEAASGTLTLGPSSNLLNLAPTASPRNPEFTHFGGLLAKVTMESHALSAGELAELSKPTRALDELVFEDGSRPWAVQTRAWAGMSAPQDPSTLPHSSAPPQKGHASVASEAKDEVSGSSLTLREGWQLVDAAEVKEAGEQISTGGFAPGKWLSATVPGTVLTTMIDRGIYPDPDFGLNNMAIPEDLSRKSFWYRRRFNVPSAMRGRSLTLTFHGTNYRATVYVNGTRVGEIVGAFRHKGFDVTALLKPEEANVVAVRIDPPPHPGIPHEQSIAAGGGNNGGQMMLDGPTFGATEGWDWIPGIRDRNIGLWQDVTLTASGNVTIQSPQIITHLPLADRSRAEISLRVPLRNASQSSVKGTLEIGFDDVHLTKPISLPAGETVVALSPADFKQLIVQSPRLWWPNGYGDPALHTMTVSFKVGNKESDERRVRFGMRELTYEISAFDSKGSLRRVEVSPTAAKLLGMPSPVQQTHEGFRETPEGWVTTLVPAMEHSAALRDLSDASDLRTAPFLVLRVNGVRIACKGGSWGMDDMRKRVSRERLEPYFRLHREANVNMIRNWMGQDTEDTFYDLADEYGLLVWNDFWSSTQDYNLEPLDPALFLENARDVVMRQRNHPSIVVWCGRNEGVPGPTINEGLAALIAEEDGTRYYSADSNKINLHDSGPYKYQDPEEYFTTLSLGFAVEVGTPSPPTLESFQAFLPKEDQWPISDAWAYHDWHQDGNGDVAPFMQAMADEFGAPNDLADFDRKAQMLNYVDHRALFEGMNAHLWAPNSGRMLWMTQPAWPSTVWQIFSHDFDTQASFYGVKKAAEPIHVQMNLPGHEVVVVNNSEKALEGLGVSERVFDLEGKLLVEKQAVVHGDANATSPAFDLPLTEVMKTAGVVLIKLQMKDASGALLSDNFYWLAGSKFAYNKMDRMPAEALSLTAKAAVKDAAGKAENNLVVTLTNGGSTPALAAKLTLLDAVTHERILPAYYTDNYVSLLPGESKTISIAYPKSSGGSASVALRGWNVVPQTIAATQ